MSNKTAMTRELTARQLAERADWKRRQALQPSLGTLLAPTLPERINRLNPQERHEVRTLIRSMKLRKIIRRTLAEAYWLGQPLPPQPDLQHTTSMQRLRRTVEQHESLLNYERALTGSSDAAWKHFEPVITKSNEPTIIEVPHGR